MASSGPNSGGTFASDNSLGGTVAWVLPGRAVTSDDSYTTSVVADAESEMLKVTNFGFAIPTGATINGIVVEIEKKASGTSVNDINVMIVKADGTYGATNKAAAESWPTSDAYTTYGASDNLWGETWTAENINDVDFGVGIACYAPSSRTASIDHVRITVYYTEAGSGTVQVQLNLLTLGVG
jgi:hypothetical protein